MENSKTTVEKARYLPYANAVTIYVKSKICHGCNCFLHSNDGKLYNEPIEFIERAQLIKKKYKQQQ